MDELNSSGFAYQMDPFATDALVFLVNQSNPVDSLTADQVRDIYTGKITNWSQVGGDDVGIVPFQRNAGAGSQGAMERLVMGGQPMMEAPADYVRGRWATWYRPLPPMTIRLPPSATPSITMHTT